MLTLPPKADVIKKLVSELGAKVLETEQPYTSVSFLVKDAKIIRPLLTREVKNYNDVNALRDSPTDIGVNLSKNNDGSYVLIATDYSSAAIDELVSALVDGGKTLVVDTHPLLDDATAGMLSMEAYELFAELEPNSDTLISAMYCHQLAPADTIYSNQLAQVLAILYESSTDLRANLSPNRTELLQDYEFYGAEIDGEWHIYYDRRTNIDVFVQAGHPNAQVSTIVVAAKAVTGNDSTTRTY